MGEPAEPTEAEREKRRQLAAAIVEAVRCDEDLPLPVDFDARVGTVREQVEQLAFDLAQEITILVAEREGRGS